MQLQKPTARPALTRPKAQAGTRQGSGAIALEGVDGRSWGARRYRELVADLVEHLGGEVTAPQEALIRRAGQLQVWCEEQEAVFARNEPFDVALYTTAANALRRLLVDLGLERKARDVTPDLRAYIGQRSGPSRDEGAAT